MPPSNALAAHPMVLTTDILYASKSPSHTIWIAAGCGCCGTGIPFCAAPGAGDALAPTPCPLAGPAIDSHAPGTLQPDMLCLKHWQQC